MSFMPLITFTQFLLIFIKTFLKAVGETLTAACGDGGGH